MLFPGVAMTYPATYYSQTKADDFARPTLERETTADVAVIGGGLAGLSAALQMSRAGKKVVVPKLRASVSVHPGAMAGLSAPALPQAAMKLLPGLAGLLPRHCINYRLKVSNSFDRTSTR